MPWAILCRSDNKLDGKRGFLLGRYSLFNGPAPKFLAGYTTMAFETREDARKYIRERPSLNEIRHRPDLRAEPHGEKPPKVVKVRIEVVQ